MSAPVGSTERIARNAGLKVLVQATRLASLALVIAMARVLGPAEFGKFTFAYALATMLGVALEFGVSPVLTRGVARDPAATAAQWAAAATLKLGLLALAGPLFLALPLLARRPWDTTAAVWLLGLALALQSFVENGVSVFTGVQRLDHELRVRLVEKSVLVVAGFTALGLGAGLLGVVCAFVLAAAVSLGLTTGLIHRRLARLDGWWEARGGVGARARARAGRPGAPPRLRHRAPGPRGRGAPRRRRGRRPLRRGLPRLRRPVDRARHADRGRLSRARADAVGVAALPRADDPGGRGAAPGRLARRAGLGVGAPWLIGWIYGPGYLRAAPALALLGAAVGCAMVQHFCGVVFLALDQPRRLRAVAALAFLTSALVTPGFVLAGGAVGAAAGGARRRAGRPRREPLEPPPARRLAARPGRG